MEKQLRRVKQGAVLGGVAGGIAQYFNVDVVIIRLLFVISLFVSFGVSLFAYIVLWVVLPEDNTFYQIDNPMAPGSPTYQTTPPPVNDSVKRDRNIKIIAIGLIGFGVFILLDQYNVWYSLSKYFWPVAMIALGAYLLLKKRDQDMEARYQNPPSPGGPETPTENPPSDPSYPDNPEGNTDSEDSFKVN